MSPITRCLIACALLTPMLETTAAPLLIDDFTRTDGRSALGTPWRVVTDQVMGGVSTARMGLELHAGRRALCLRGEVSLANNGGFAQINLALAPRGDLDASAYTGVRLVVRGNGEDYKVHLKTPDTLRPWQSYRADLPTGAAWSEVRIPFADFTPHRLAAPLDRSRLSRLGLVAIGQAMTAELCVAELAFY
jgi:hypothetical protein